MPQPDINLIDDLEIPVKDEAGRFDFIRIMNHESRIKEDKKKEPIDVEQKTGIQDKGKLHDSSFMIHDSSLPKARHYIDAEDEQEIAKIKVPQIQADETQVINNEAKKITEDLGLEFDQEKKIRLERVIVSYLKGIRNSLEIKEVLRRDSGRGGLGLSEQEINMVINKLEKAKKVIEFRIQNPSSAKATAGRQELRIKEKVKPKQVEDMFENQESRIKNQESRLEESQVKEQRAKDKIYDSKLITEIKPRAKIGSQTEAIKANNLPEWKYSQAKLVGPVEEMKLITLEDFRHLSAKPDEAAQRIYQKIDLLADESLELKAQAIKAWKQSPIYKAYLDIGHKSMELSKPVEDLIKAKSVSEMNLEEFEAIGDLNRSLQF